MRVLVIEDDSKIASFVVNGLKQNGFAVDHASDGEKGLALAGTVTYDAAVLDIMLPKLDGLSLLRQLRQDKILTPVLILSAKASVDDRVKGLQAGGDDYLTKPFAFSELLARVQALIRRATHTAEPTKLSAGDLTMDLLTREVTRNGQKIELAIPRVRPARIAAPPSRSRGHQDHDFGASLGLQLRPANQRRGRARPPVAREGGQGFSVKLIQTIRGVGYVLKPA
jgi:two-component system OmpR family response regulator